MKLAWLCWGHCSEDDEGPIIIFREPGRYEFRKVIPIVYAEIKE